MHSTCASSQGGRWRCWNYRLPWVSWYECWEPKLRSSARTASTLYRWAPPPLSFSLSLAWTWPFWEALSQTFYLRRQPGNSNIQTELMVSSSFWSWQPCSDSHLVSGVTSTLTLLLLPLPCLWFPWASCFFFHAIYEQLWTKNRRFSLSSLSLLETRS